MILYLHNHAFRVISVTDAPEGYHQMYTIRSGITFIIFLDNQKHETPFLCSYFTHFRNFENGFINHSPSWPHLSF